MKTRVIGTAGHIDHGKTSLVRMLTGVDLDTAPEEKERGITIALGFTATTHGDDRIAWVDVPGHERLVRTMIAGATGLDGAVLVVSAAEGVMPQTREHLAILELLGVRHGVIALTMADLVDDELLELAALDVEEAVAGTFLEGAQVIPTSTQDQRGRQALLDALEALPIPTRGDEGVFRLPVDRAFVRPGFGTVVTGTAASGTLRDGTNVTLHPSGITARVRGLEVHGTARPQVVAGERVAINLAGIERSDVTRGEVVAIDPLPMPHVIDVLYTHLAGAEPLEDGQSVRVLSGTAEVLGRLHLAAEVDGLTEGTLPAQIRLDSPLPCLPGDRFIVRRTSPMTTLGGGRIVDPWARRMRKRDRARVADEVQRLVAGDTLVWLERAGDLGLEAHLWARRGGVGGVQVANQVLAPTVFARHQQALLDALDAFHAHNPLALGANRRELRRDALGHLPEKLFDAVVESSPTVVTEGPRVRLTGFAVQLTPAHEQLQADLLQAVANAGLEGIAASSLHTAFPQPEVEPLLRLAEHAGLLLQVAALGWVHQAAIDGLLTTLRAYFDGADGLLTPGEFKDLTGLTRKAAIPLLEWCDKQRYLQFNEAGKRARGSQL